MGNIIFPPPKTKGALRGGDNMHLSTAPHQTPEGEGGQCTNKGKGGNITLPTDNKGALKGRKCRRADDLQSP